MSLTQQLAANAGLLGALPAPDRTLSLATLISWLVSVASGSSMLGTWLLRGGLSRYRASREGLPPGVIFAHFGLAVTGLAAWAAFLGTGWMALAWTAAIALMPVAGLGISTVTLWVPYPTGTIATGSLTPPAEDKLTGRVTDEMLARALTDDALAGRLIEQLVAQVPAAPARRRSWRSLAVLLPVGHGAAAITTILLTMVTVSVASAAAAA
jgi:hypothetical protein